MKRFRIFLSVCLYVMQAAAVSAQGFSTTPTKPRPWGRVSFYTNSSRITPDDGDPRTFTELSTALAYQLPDTDDSGADYGIDARYATYPGNVRPDRVSLYEGFAGARMAGGRLRARIGHVWLNDLGSLGSLAGGVVEYRQHRMKAEEGRWRAGAFGGLEPQVLNTGYAPGVRKMGAFVGFDGAEARRHSVGYVLVKHGSLNERSVMTTNNFLPIGRKVFVYQAAEYNLQQPAGMAKGGLGYLVANGRVTPHPRLELQANYNRGRSIDARGLTDDLLSGRPIVSTSLDGLLYQSVGGRATVEVLPRVRVYAGYSRDRNNRDTEPTGRTLVGGYASNIAGSGFDVTASDSLMTRPDNSYHSRYVSLGRQIGRSVYVSGDLSTSLSVVRFSRSDGITIETRPHTVRMSGMVSAYMTKSQSITATIERSNETGLHDVRVLLGLSYRLR